MVEADRITNSTHVDLEHGNDDWVGDLTHYSSGFSLVEEDVGAESTRVGWVLLIVHASDYLGGIELELVLVFSESG